MEDQREIDYADVKNLGFKEEETKDEVFYNNYGYHYRVITLQLTKTIHLDWDISTRFCEMIRCDSEGCVLGRFEIDNLNKLKEIVNFFDEEVEMLA